jgi:hypothetical protein
VAQNPEKSEADFIFWGKQGSGGLDNTCNNASQLLLEVGNFRLAQASVAQGLRNELNDFMTITSKRVRSPSDKLAV